MDDLPGGGFAHRAGDRHDFERVHPPILTGQVAQRADRIGDFQRRRRERAVLDGPIHNGADRPPSEGIAQIVMSVELLAPDGKKAVALADRTRISTDTGDRRLAITGEFSSHELRHNVDG